ncbi:hypothetical protein PUN28_019843 [Cardiocondyla obscurior]|uniref:Uncharacterized protein n=1 Tax=Cardiocondyla obscurior TaxID=286306 RepID=A0AAW2EAK4_9HYME
MRDAETTHLHIIFDSLITPLRINQIILLLQFANMRGLFVPFKVFLGETTDTSAVRGIHYFNGYTCRGYFGSPVHRARRRSRKIDEVRSLLTTQTLSRDRLVELSTS